MVFDIYLIIHFPTGLGYVGLTKLGYLARWKSHVNAAKYSIKHGKQPKMLITRFLIKYGVEDFVLLRLVQVTELEVAKQLERKFIVCYDTKFPNGLNLTAGGDGIWGYKFTSEQLIRLSASHLGKSGRVWTLAERAAASARNKGQVPNAYALGPKPPHVCEALRQAARKRKPSKKMRKAVSRSNRRRKGEKRKPYPTSHGSNVSRALSGRVQSRALVEKRANSNRGRKRSAEFKALCRENALARIAVGWRPGKK